MHQEVVMQPPKGLYGRHDLWELWSLDYGREVPCNSVFTLLHYLFSEGTRDGRGSVHLGRISKDEGEVDVKVFGPLADDEERHTLRFCLTKENVEELTARERNLLVYRLSRSYPKHLGGTPKKVLLACGALGIPPIS